MTLYDLVLTVWLFCVVIVAVYAAAVGLFALGAWWATRSERDEDVLGEIPTRRW